MLYPDGFDTPVFPAGKTLAVSRAMSIGTMVVFFLIVCMCAVLLWAKKSIQVHPFLVSVNDVTGQWEVIGHQHDNHVQMTADRTLQESVLGNFVRTWFSVAESSEYNSDVWSECDRKTQCNPNNKQYVGNEKCVIYCISSDNVYDTFVSSVMPVHWEHFNQNDFWRPDMSMTVFTPIGEITENGGVWQIRATVYSNLSVPVEILAYAQINRDKDIYPKTMGYYVADFNAYKIN